MSRCTNTQIGEMLHAYELHILTVSETDMFERHLLECSSCAEELKRSATVASFLNHDRAIGEIALRLTGTHDQHESIWRRLLWPADSFVLLRPALLVLLLLLLAYPAYQGLKFDTVGRPSIVPIQRQVGLVQTRSGEAPAEVRMGDRTSLTVKFPQVTRKEVYRIEILRATDHLSVYSNSQTRFDESLTATLLIEPNTLSVGDYLVRLRLVDGTGDWQDLSFLAVN